MLTNTFYSIIIIISLITLIITFSEIILNNKVIIYRDKDIIITSILINIINKFSIL